MNEIPSTRELLKLSKNIYSKYFLIRKVTKSPLGLFCFSFFFFITLFFLVVLGLRCCTRAFSSCSERGLLFVAVHGLPIAVASLVAEQGL